jgi:hypothetical protein
MGVRADRRGIWDAAPVRHKLLVSVRFSRTRVEARDQVVPGLEVSLKYSASCELAIKSDLIRIASVLPSLASKHLTRR